MAKTKFTQELFDSICNDIATSSKSLREICKANGFNSKAFYAFKRKDIKNHEMYEKARCLQNKSQEYVHQQGMGNEAYRSQNARKTNIKKFKGKLLSIYVLNIVGTNYYKIGVSNKPNRRIRDLKSATPFNIDTLYCNEYEEAYELENEIHQKIRDSYIKSEWFELSPAQVAEVIFNLTLKLK